MDKPQGANISPEPSNHSFYERTRKLKESKIAGQNLSRIHLSEDQGYAFRLEEIFNVWLMRGYGVC